MKNKIILNIPHSSTRLTKEFKTSKKFLENKDIKTFNKQMTDLYTDQLFSHINYTNVKAKFSRIVCDVEKFVDDKKEIMSKYGLGVIYTNNIKGEKFLKLTNNYKNHILNKYYYPYHKRLDNLVKKHLIKNNVILIDCHSFSEDIIVNKNLNENLPDICLGIDEKKYNNILLNDFTYNYFKTLGYNVKINYPYYGTMIPDFLLKENHNNFYSIMIEINRNLYLKKYKKNDNFRNLKNQIAIYLKSLKSLDLTRTFQ